MYDRAVNTSQFNFINPIIIKEKGFKDRYNFQIKLFLTQENFNFNHINSDGSDIRFAEHNDGNNSLFYWVPVFDYENKQCEVWIEIPFIGKNQTKEIYMIYGNDSAVNRSNLNNLNFIFKYHFDHTPISSYLFGGITGRSYNEYGYDLGDFRDEFFTTTKPLKNFKDWEVFVKVYIYSDSVDRVGGDDHVHKFELVGEENGIDFEYIYSDTIEHNIKNGELEEYNEPYIGYETGSYNLYYYAYKELDDKFFYGTFGRKTFPDYSSFLERRVEGNTRISDIRFLGRRYCYVDHRIKYVLARKYLNDEIEVDTSNLYSTMEDMDFSVNIMTEDYTEDFSSTDYYHESSCGGYPVNISNNLFGDHGTGWISDDDVSEGYVIIDFIRDNDSLVDRNYYHLDSSHAFRYNASKLSDDSLTEYDHWTADYTTGWAAIDFGDTPKKVNCLCLQGPDENGMVKEFEFYGGYLDPRFNQNLDDWMFLYKGVCDKTEDKQFFYFRNFSPYRYYTLKVLSTYGDKIKLKNWYMYRSPNMDIFEGIMLDRISLLPYVYESNNNYFPRQIGVEATNDYKQWDTLMDLTYTYNPFKENAYGFWQHFKFSNYSNYRAYKLILKDNWTDSTKFALDGWMWTRSLIEERTHRILSTEDDNILSVVTQDNTDFDGGWLFAMNQDELFYVYDNYLSRQFDITKEFEFNLSKPSLIKK